MAFMSTFLPCQFNASVLQWRECARSKRVQIFWILSCLFVAAAWNGSLLQAEDFHENFDGKIHSCKVYFDHQGIRLKTHERNESLAFSGQAAERFQFEASQHDVSVVIECDIPPARVIDDLSISISVSSNRPGAQLLARVVFPGQKEPNSDKPLTRFLNGNVLKKTNAWRELRWDTSAANIARHLALWRASIKPQVLDHREMYIDKIYLKQTLGPGMTEILIDELRVSPIVVPKFTERIEDDSESTWWKVPKVEFQLDQLLTDGKPIFPVVIPYLHEPIALFDQLGVNVVWVDNYQNTNLIQQLNRQGIWTTAWPPSAKSESGEILDAASASLLPFGKETQGILFWNLGMQNKPEMHQQMQHWINQVKTSDRELNRPILADVTGSEAIFSRDVEMLGISKHIIQTSYSFREYADHLQRRMRIAQPGTFVMTWLQTEPSRTTTEFREASNYSPAVVEPEQIRLQTYTALCAGCKGIGYWNWTPLNAEGPGLEERRLVLEELTQELELLEPFLAGGEVIHRFDVSLTKANKSSTSNSGRYSLDQDSFSVKQKENQKNKAIEPDDDSSLQAMAAVVRSEHGQVILLCATEENAQFVPGQMAGNDVRIKVRGLPESAFLWEITTTGLWPLETKRVTGYTEIRLPRFNMTAALMVATDQSIAEKMERKIRQMQARNAELALLLAKEKFARVLKVDRQLTELGVGLPEATHILAQARRAIDQGNIAFEKQQHNPARRNAKLASRLLRILQRSHWERAVASLSSPTSTPHTICFQTLPDFWKLVQQLGGEFEEISLLRSGQFEDRDAMKVEGWKRDVSASKDILVYDALDPNNPFQGEYCLRAASIPAQGKQGITLNEPAITYASPLFSPKLGDLLHISGSVRIPRPIQGSLEGFRIYDTHFGHAACLHWTKASDWQSFELIRPIWKQEDIQIIMELNGLGDVAIDDLKVKIIRFKNPDVLRQASGEQSENPASATKSRPNALEFLNRLLK